MSFPRTLGELRRSEFSEERLRTRHVKDELRDNLIVRLRANPDAPVFPGIVGFDDTVIPQIVNAILSRQQFRSFCSACGARPKAASLRALTTLLDGHMPYLAKGCRDSRQSLCADLPSAAAKEVAKSGDDLPIAYLTPRRS